MNELTEAMAHNEWTSKRIADRSEVEVGMSKQRERRRNSSSSMI